MSDDDSCNLNCSESNSIEYNAHYIFVKLLAKHKVLLGMEKSSNNHDIKYSAAAALCKEYNKLCDIKLTKRKVLKKVCNMKARLKEKNYKNLIRTKKLKYTDWEKMFLDLWVGSGITVLANKLDKSSDVVSPSEIITSNDIRVKEKTSNKLSDVRSERKNYSRDDIRVKIEVDDDFLQDTRGSEMSAVAWRGEHETRFDDDDEDEYSKYESMTIDELKQIALVAEIKLLKEKKAAARAKKELKTYKLFLLK